MIKFVVTPDGADPYEVTATARDVLVWERTSRTNMTFDDLMKRLSFVELYRLAWIASRRLGLFSGELAAFETTCEVDPDKDEDDGSEGEVLPTPSAV